MAGQRRRKRPRVLRAELSEPSSSRVVELESGTPDAVLCEDNARFSLSGLHGEVQRVLRSAEVDPSSSVSINERDDAHRDAAQTSSIQVVMEDHVHVPGTASVIALERQGHTELPAEQIVQASPSQQSQSNSPIETALQDHVEGPIEAPIDDDTRTNSPQQADLEHATEEGQADLGHATEEEQVEAPSDRNLNEVVVIESIPPTEAGTSLDASIHANFESSEQGEQVQASVHQVVNEEPFVSHQVVNEEPFVSLAAQASTSTAVEDSDNQGEGGKAAENCTNKSNSSYFILEEVQEDKTDGMNCPICMDPWTGEGMHRICCLACGHLFGRSCIRKWLQQQGKKNSKCPHCNRKARIEDIRDLYIPTLTVIDDKNQQLREELELLKSKNEQLLVQNTKLRKEQEHLQALLMANSYSPGISGSKDNFSSKRALHSSQDYSRREAYGKGSQLKHGNYIQASVMDMFNMKNVNATHSKGSPGQFELQEEFSLMGARVFDMDAHSQMLLVAQKSTAVGGAFNLNKISLLSLSDALVMPLPQNTGAVRDIRVAPPGGKLPGRLALVASLGKIISLFSLESNNVVLSYKLQSPCWSCAWDPHEPNYVFAGLQDGSLTIFDLRQTSSALISLQSLCRQPLHSLYPINYGFSLPHNINRNGFLSACSSGVCFWESSTPGLHDWRPHTVTCEDNPGICVALAYNHIANEAVVTFREKPNVHQPGSAHNHTAEAPCAEPNIVASQPNSHLSLGSHSVKASHYPLNYSNSRSSGGLQNHDIALQSTYLSNVNGGWMYGKPMFGNVSPVGMHRSSIICSLSRESSSVFPSIFAFGDEETHALMLWDVRTLSVIDCLKPHRSPILDVKGENIGDHSLLACISNSNLQVYKR
ncbi:hypothetical protein KP509_12G038200 [Ceratopteris richardii]|uniref:RING-type E3 ubiquitin transferase n=1 Tax=Ceratopteris richardii TaxID=49495 RepID=A0A8T2TI84_CERRI|nr:hypothetical protein KP509_12G038200 [Ceratopteris richardii]